MEGYNRCRIVTRCRSFKGSLRHSAPSGHCTLQTARLYSTMQYRKFKSENLCLLRWIHHVRVVNGKGGVYYVRADNSHRSNRLRSICRRHQNGPRVLHKDSRSLSYQPIDRRSSLTPSDSHQVSPSLTLLDRPPLRSPLPIDAHLLDTTPPRHLSLKTQTLPVPSCLHLTPSGPPKLYPALSSFFEGSFKQNDLKGRNAPIGVHRLKC